MRKQICGPSDTCCSLKVYRFASATFIYHLEGFFLSSDGPVFWLFWVLCWRSPTPDYCYHWYNWQHPLHSCLFMPCQKNEYISQSDGLFGILWHNLSGIIDIHFRCSSSLAIHSNNICIYSLHYTASTNCSYRNQWLVYLEPYFLSLKVFYSTVDTIELPLDSDMFVLTIILLKGADGNMYTFSF